jgi:hypothetical protein
MQEGMAWFFCAVSSCVFKTSWVLFSSRPMFYVFHSLSYILWWTSINSMWICWQSTYSYLGVRRKSVSHLWHSYLHLCREICQMEACKVKALRHSESHLHRIGCCIYIVENNLSYPSWSPHAEIFILWNSIQNCRRDYICYQWISLLRIVLDLLSLLNIKEHLYFVCFICYYAPLLTRMNLNFCILLCILYVCKAFRWPSTQQLINNIDIKSVNILFYPLEFSI